MKWQFIVTHTIRQTQIPALPDSWAANTPSVKMLCPQNNCLFSYFVSVGLLTIGQVFFLSHAKLCIGGLRKTDFSIAIFQTACSRSFISYGIE